MTDHGYRATCPLPAADMTCVVKAMLLIEGRDPENCPYDAYSADRYAYYILDHMEEEQEYADAADMVKAMLNYAASAQEFFGRNTGTLANRKLKDADKQYDSVIAEDKGRPYDIISEILPVGVTFVGATLSLKSQTTLSLYFKRDQPPTFSCNKGMNVETQTKGEYQIARIRNIPARLLSSYLTVSLGNVGSVTYSPLTYCYNVLSDPAQPESLKHVALTLYLYSQAADAYFHE